MGTSTPGERDFLLAQARELYGRVVYSHKAHEKQADIYDARHRRFQWCKVSLAAASSGTFLAALAGVFLEAQISSLVISFVALLLSAATLAGDTFEYGEATQRHRDCAARLWSVRESYLSLIVTLQSSGADLPAARERRDDLQAELKEAYGNAPRTSPRAYRKAQRGLQNQGDISFDPGELDRLLPEQLRQGRDDADV
ncbi:SLATT domain-containing protein [Agrococcus sp. SGAir0287]|uniref:SLATT domain-containing protein n=1 Tax=Agrococcus sp. SGAir0287 TaxID=2070347 RepID=UPI0010CD4559|nr:SLATT domain-containing protein [Agrococcus sp. SGAir0287]QCR19192.1 hypothetical protein C1N71_06905 [Agrococcus sp. SGAir0287]